VISATLSPVGLVHGLANLGPHSGVVGHGRQFGPLVDGSDRVGFFADSGRPNRLALNAQKYVVN
jgi:hypothetical protein